MKNLPHLLSRFVQTPLMVHPPKLDLIVRALSPRLGIQIEGPMLEDGSTPDLKASYSEEASEIDYCVEDGIAIIPVQGTLIKKSSWLSSWSGTCSYREIQQQIAAAVADGNVRGILLDIDSPGGETNGCFELSDFIYSVRGKKPIFAAADDIALSAAYAIASAADKIFVTRTGAVGSIGVYALHVEQSAWEDKLGVKYTYVFAGQKKIDGNPHAPLSDRAASDIQMEVDREYGIFTATVARNRKAAEKEIVATQAGLYWAESAIPLLADEVGTKEDALAALSAASGINSGGRRSANAAAQAANSEEGDDMAKITPEAGALQPKATGAEDDKECTKTAGAGPEVEDDDEDDEEEGEDKEKMKDKKAAASIALAAAPIDVRSHGDIKAITALCKMAGCTERAGEFLTSRQSVSDVSELLVSEQAAAADKARVSGRVDPNRSTAGVSMQELEAQARTFAQQNRGVTKEQAFTQMLEANPEAYSAYRSQHNAKALMATLEAAGVSFRQ